MANLHAAREVEKELGAEIVVINKTSPEYDAHQEKPACPSVAVNGKFIARNDVVSDEAVKDAIVSDSGRKEG